MGCGEICTATCGILGLSGCIAGCLAVVGTTSAPAGVGCVTAAAVSGAASAALSS